MRVVLVCLGLLASGDRAAANLVVNPSFEADGYITFGATPPTGWSYSTTEATLRGDTSGVPSDGSLGARFYLATSGSVIAGDASSVSQALDLTNVLEITFDTNLACAPGPCGWHGFLEATFYVGGTQLWSSQSMGTEPGHSIDTSSLTGVRTLEFRLEAIANGSASGTSSHFSFDNVFAIPEPSTALMLGGGIVGLALLRRRPPAIH